MGPACGSSSCSGDSIAQPGRTWHGDVGIRAVGAVAAARRMRCGAKCKRATPGDRQDVVAIGTKPKWQSAPAMAVHWGEAVGASQHPPCVAYDPNVWSGRASMPRQSAQSRGMLCVSRIENDEHVLASRTPLMRRLKPA